MADEPEMCTKISEKVKMAGFLEKKGSMLWKKYWFVLEDKLLLYYKSQLEYINLSPCRGSLNMNLVSTVQPRRNSPLPIIHLVTRANSLILKARDRESQEQWLKALLDSVGKQGMGALRFSLDDLPGEIQSATLPRRLHTGSLDAVWKPAVIPKNKMLDKVLGYNDDTDENQNDMDLSMTKERKSLTLDRSKMDSRFDKLRNAIARRKSSTSLPSDTMTMTKPIKNRRESFIHKMFKKTAPKVEEQPVKTIAVDSDVDDPLYDTIDHAKMSTEQLSQKSLSGKIQLPEGMMAELKDRLKTKDSNEEITQKPSNSLSKSSPSSKGHNDTHRLGIEEPIEPPELPPRVYSSLTALDMITTEAVIHPQKQDDSEDSEVSGHYQTIKKSAPSEPKPLKVEVEYQVINKDKKKKKVVPVKNEPADLSKLSANTHFTLPADLEASVIANKELYEMTTSFSEEIDDSVEQKLEENEPSVKSKTNVDAEEESLNNKTTNNSEDSKEPEQTEEVSQKETEQIGDRITEKDELKIEDKISDEDSKNQEQSEDVKAQETEQVVNTTPLLKILADEKGEALKQEETGSGDVKQLEKEQFAYATPEFKIEIVEKSSEVKEEALKEMEKGLCELNSLLMRLTEIASAPLIDRGGLSSWSGGEGEQVPPPKLQRSHSDPDYDIPRPHVPLAEAESLDDPPFTPGFNPEEESASTSSSNSLSLEPDSLESKKDNFETCS